jgi:hypothetical protein
MIEGLRRHGFTFGQIQELTGIQKCTLILYRDGATPKHAEGERIIGVWLSAMNATREQLPMRAVLLSAAAALR